MNISNKLIIEIDITHRCNMRCRHCNRLCNSESLYGVTRIYKDMEKKHIDYLCSQIKSYPKGRVGLLRIIGGEPLLSNILEYAISRFEDLLAESYAETINIVTNGTVTPSDKCKPYLVYAPVCVGEMVKSRGRELPVSEVYKIKNIKHRNITVSPIDLKQCFHTCGRLDVCGIQYSVYGFSYTAACFPAMYVASKNHKHFLHYLPEYINDFFKDGFENDVCAICVSAIEDYKSYISRHPEVQNEHYFGNAWSGIIKENKKQFEEPNTTWIDSISC